MQSLPTRLGRRIRFLAPGVLLLLAMGPAQAAVRAVQEEGDTPPVLVPPDPEQPGDAPAVEPQPEPVPEPLARESLAAWKNRFTSRGSWWSGAKIQLRQLVRGAVAEAETSPAAMTEVANLLLDLGSSGLRGLPSMAHMTGGSDLQRTRREAFNALSGMLESELDQRLSTHLAEVVAAGYSHSTARRHLAAYLCSRHRTPAGRQALMSVAWDEGDALRPDALALLTRWPEDAVDLFLVRLLGRPFDRRARPHPFNVLLERIQKTDRALGARASMELSLRLQHMLLSTNWREAARAVELSAGLEPDRRVPLLIDALSTWKRRNNRGTGSPRVYDDIVQELQLISGRSVGRNPRNWITWWIAVREGQTPLHVDRDEEVPRSRTGFFGLRPVTDRVTFIIDISGSMRETWNTEEHSRYVEAIEQMMRFLQGMGESGRFNVILFSSAPVASSPHLVAASAENLERARTSLLAREPKGGTNLRSAVQLALRLDSRGDLDPSRLEADTIVLLCDGETAEGSRWVRPLFDRIQAEAQVKIHCVLVGTKGDGTLEALSGFTGGEFIRID